MFSYTILFNIIFIHFFTFHVNFLPANLLVLVYFLFILQVACTSSLELKGLAQAKIIKESVILVWLLDMTI